MDDESGTATAAEPATAVQVAPEAPARPAVGGAVIPLRSKEQVARRDALRARMDEDLARRKDAQKRSPQR